MQDRSASDASAPANWPVGWVIRFFVLTAGLSVPFWLLGAAISFQLMPGLPVSALAILCPGAAAIVLTIASEGPTGAARLLRRLADARRTALAALLLIIGAPLAVNLMAFVLQRWMGVGVPEPHFAFRPTIILALLFLFAAACEELGWTGVALEPLLARIGLVPAGLTIGAAWAVWHYVPLFQADRAPGWIAWWTLGTIATRLVMVWVYVHGGRSLFGAILFHAMNNLCWQLYPVHGSYFDPALSGALMALAAIALLVRDFAAKRLFTPR